MDNERFPSGVDKARDQVDAAEAPDGNDPLRPLVVIDLDDLREDMRDPAWQDFLQRATAYRRRLRELGNLH